MSDIISPRVRIGEDTITFNLRVISLEEENLYVDQMAKIKDDDPDKFDKQYDIIVRCLGQWSEEVPTRASVNEETGKPEELPIGEGTPVKAMKEYFAEKTNEKERALQSVMYNYRARMVPDVSFL